MKKYELLPVYDSKKSFYNKAIIEEESGIKKLYSYNTLVCTLYQNNNIILNNNVDQSLLFSHTTLRHIKEFLKQFYYNSDHNITKKDLLKLL